MIALMPDAIRCDRASYFTFMERLLSEPLSESIRQLRYLQSGEHSGKYEWNSWGFTVLDSCVSEFSRAFLVRQWNMCLHGYEFMIEDLEAAVEQSKTEPW